MITVIIIANLIIVAGYLFISFSIAPKLGVTRNSTIYGGIAFFFLCAATHSEEALHAFTEKNYWTIQHTITMLVISVLQAVAVWTFIAGLYNEFVLPNTPLRRKDDKVS